MRRFNMAPEAITKLWKPYGGQNKETDQWPECARCTAHYGYRCAVEAYEIVDMGTNRIEVMGRCKGNCNRPSADREPRLHPSVMGRDNYHDVVRITWERLGGPTAEAQLNSQFFTDLKKQISAIRFFEPDAGDVT